MSEPPIRDILNLLRELRGIVPPVESALRPIQTIRQLLAARRRRVVRYILFSCSAAAAAIVMAVIFIERKSNSVPLIAAPAAQLKQAVQATNQYRGVVQISLEEVKLDSTGQPQA